MTILAQEHPLEYSRVVINRDPKTGSFKATTTNVSRLELDVPMTPSAVRCARARVRKAVRPALPPSSCSVCIGTM